MQVNLPPLDPKALRTLQILASNITPRFRAKIIRINRDVVGPTLRAMIRDNFDRGGEPQFKQNSKITLWLKRLHGQHERPLMATGQFYDKVIANPVIEADETSVTVRPRRITSKMSAYLRILHNDRRDIYQTQTEKSRKFFWKMYYLAKQMGDTDMAQIFARIATKKAHRIIRIPARPWTKLTVAQKNKLEKIVRENYWKTINELTA